MPIRFENARTPTHDDRAEAASILKPCAARSGRPGMGGPSLLSRAARALAIAGIATSCCAGIASRAAAAPLNIIYPEAKAPPEAPATAPAPRRALAGPTYAVPRLSNITIDGKVDDWRDGGFRVDAIGALGPIKEIGAAEAAAFPSAQIGWDDNGLLVFVRAHDKTPSESSDDKTLWLRDSVEVFLADADHPSQRYQIVISPGVDPAHPELRQKLYDQRVQHEPVAVLVDAEAAASKTDDGYIVEMRIPWSNLGLAPREGLALLAQIQVNDAAEGSKAFVPYRWSMSDDAATDSGVLQRIRLAGEGERADAITAWVATEFQDFRRLRIRVTDLAPTPTEAITLLDLHTRQPVAGTARQVRKGPPAQATIDIPLTGEDLPFEALLVMRDGEPLAAVPIDRSPFSLAKRKEALRAAPMHMGFIFAVDRLPTPRFDDPLKVEDIAGGEYSISTRYFDAELNEVTEAKLPGRYGAVVEVKTGRPGLADRRCFTLYRSPLRIESWRSFDAEAIDARLPNEAGIDPMVVRRQSHLIGDHLAWLGRRNATDDDTMATLLAGLAALPPEAPPLVQRLDPFATAARFWHALDVKLNANVPYPYAVALPADYDRGATTTYPAILFLHGAGERGADLRRVCNSGLLRAVSEGRVGAKYSEDFPFIVIAPACPAGEWWQPEKVSELLDEACAKYRVDPDRLYVTGLSMGGYGTWQLAIEHPERFAAIAPICGIGDDKDMARIKDLPVWAFHGDADTIVPFDADKRGVDALKAVGGRVRFTVYPGVGHDSWTSAYGTEELYTWLLGQRRGAPGEPAAR